MREAGIQELFSEAGIAPLEIVYEDAVLDLGAAANNVLVLLGLPPAAMNYDNVTLERTADETTDEWVQRFVPIDKPNGTTAPGSYLQSLETGRGGSRRTWRASSSCPISRVRK